MGILLQLLSSIQKLFEAKVEISEIIYPVPEFDGKYKIIIKHGYDFGNGYDNAHMTEVFEWINLHSNGSVDVKLSETSRHCYIAFEDLDDALVFKIIYST